MDKQGSATLYYRCAGGENSSPEAVVRPISIEPEPLTLTFEIGGDSGRIKCIDFHFLSRQPGEPVAYIKIHSVKIEAIGSAGDSKSPLLRSYGHTEISKSFTLTGLAFNDRLLGELYAVEDNDPRMQCQVPPHPEIDAQPTLLFEVVLEYLPGESYIIARDGFLARQENYEERVRVLETRTTELEASRQELERYKGSALWGPFVRAQSLYDRMLDAGRNGPLGTSLKIFSPRWWSRRRLNEYERWRTVRGCQNSPDK